MKRYCLRTGLLLLAAGSLFGFDVVGTIKKVDPDKRILVVHANNQDHTVRADKDIKIQDAMGKDLLDGLKSKDLKEGTVATFTVERDNGGPVLKMIRLGGREVQTASTGKPSVGLKPLNEMSANDNYKGQDGGLYGGGKNEPPVAHQAAAKKETAKLCPWTERGNPPKTA